MSSDLEDLVNGAIAFYQAGNNQRAIEILNEVLYKDPSNAEAHTHLGICFLNLGRDGDALQRLDSALRLDVTQDKAYFHRGRIFVRMGETVKAISDFRQTVRYDPENFEAYYELGICFYSMMRFDLAVKAFLKAARLSPDNAGYYANASLAANEFSMFTGALDLAKKAIKINPLVNYAHYAKGWALMGLGRYQEALPCLEESVRLGYDTVEVRRRRAELYHYFKRYHESIRDYLFILKKDPSNKSPFRIIKDLLPKIGHQDLASYCSLALSGNITAAEAIKQISSELDPMPPPSEVDFNALIDEISKWTSEGEARS